ncbi:type II secretion system protein GspK [uncultured Pseudodesulfovibrio sp.]|uniref:general secretion pathway protein GspK n=1 Tax=uncultured Pseudodesulfovibrio sp. TaxID=2035858 RepID=UPI0029C8CF0D|nr:type II secretion system protein GspK [uncultured Pseudodesulfovibrio sp.]
MRKDREGAVLVIVLIVLATATFLIIESARLIRIDYANSAYQRTLVAGGGLVRSGVAVAQELLMDDLKKHSDGADHKFDGWYDFDEFLQSVSGSLESGEISGNIEPEEGRINVNRLVGNSPESVQLGEVFVRLVSGVCSQQGIRCNPKPYLESIKAWTGGPDKKGDKRWYAEQDPPYSLSGVSFRSPDELLLVRWEGMTRESVAKVYNGTESVPGLREFVTIWGNGKINMNTARSEILYAIVSDGDKREAYVASVENYRSNGANQLSSPWFVGIAAAQGIDMSKFPSKALGVKSEAFRVTVNATVGVGLLRSTSIVKRSTKGPVVLFQNIY